MAFGTALVVIVILLLVVYHERFRKLFFWIAGAGLILGGLSFLGFYLYERHQKQARLVEQWTPVNETPQLEPHAIDIHGGETLRIVHSGSPAGSVPLIYLGHHQMFALVCGEYREQQTVKQWDELGTPITKPQLSAPKFEKGEVICE